MSGIYLDEKYFKDQKTKEISLEHIKEIIFARVKEIIDIIINKNTNLKNTIPKNIPIFLFFEDKNFFHNLRESFKEFFLYKSKLKIKNINDNTLEPIKISGELISKGWVREAIPVIQKRKSFISRIFSTFFD